MENIKPILESLLFVADAPLTVERLKAILIEAESKEIRQALDELQEEYQERQGGFDLRQVAGGYQFRSRNIYNEWITRLIAPSPVRLSKAALETLAIIAYKQPVIRSDVEHIRGVDCGGVLRVLLERQLIRVLGRKEIPGRPLIYATTKKFLEIFDLKDLRDLPSPKEIESFGQAIEGQVEVVDQDEIDSTQPVESQDEGSDEVVDRDETDATLPVESQDEGSDEVVDRDETDATLPVESQDEGSDEVVDRDGTDATLPVESQDEGSVEADTATAREVSAAPIDDSDTSANPQVRVDDTSEPSEDMPTPR